uniref:Uncharacterized protein n=1 Tax=Brassica campestris TaxID=3711 RepID=M4CVE6_BRACM
MRLDHSEICNSLVTTNFVTTFCIFDQSSIRACRHKRDTIHELSPVVKRMIRKAIDHVSLSILTRGGDGRVIVDACCVPPNALAPYCAATQLSGSRIWIFSICFTHHYSEYVSQR